MSRYFLIIISLMAFGLLIFIAPRCEANTYKFTIGSMLIAGCK